MAAAAKVSLRDGSRKRIRNPPKSACCNASSTASAALAGRRVSACRKMSASCVAACAPRFDCFARIASVRRILAPAAVALRVVRSSLPPSATMTSFAPAANADSTAPAIHSSSFSVGMMTDTELMRAAWERVPRSLLLRLLRRRLLRVARLAERDVDGVRAIEEGDRRPGAYAQALPHFEQRFVVGMRLQSLIDDLDRLLAISRCDVDAGQVRVVIDVVELQIDGALAEIDGRFELLLDECQAKSEVRESGGGLRRQHRRRRLLAAVDVEKDGQRAQVLRLFRQLDRFIDEFEDVGHQSNSRERSRRTKRSIRSRSASSAAVKRTPYFAVPPVNSARSTSLSSCSGRGSPGR